MCQKHVVLTEETVLDFSRKTKTAFYNFPKQTDSAQKYLLHGTAFGDFSGKYYHRLTGSTPGYSTASDFGKKT